MDELKMESESNVELPSWLPKAEGGGICQTRDGGEKKERNMPQSSVSKLWVSFGEKDPSAKPHTVGGDQG